MYEETANHHGPGNATAAAMKHADPDEVS